MKAINKTKNTVVAAQINIADSFVSRLKGLLGETDLPAGHGLAIKGCNSIHMFFMRFAIDAIFTDKNNQVVGLVENIKPFRLSPIFFKAHLVVELPAGTIQESKTELGDQINFED